jgi:hypothetical protein
MNNGSCSGDFFMVANESIQRPSVPQKPTSDNTETETLLEKIGWKKVVPPPPSPSRPEVETK